MSTGRPDHPIVTLTGFAVAGSEMVAFTLLGVLIDYLADCMPWATATLTILGLITAMVHLARLVRVDSAGRP